MPNPEVPNFSSYNSWVVDGVSFDTGDKVSIIHLNSDSSVETSSDMGNISEVRVYSNNGGTKIIVKLNGMEQEILINGFENIEKVNGNHIQLYQKNR